MICTTIAPASASSATQAANAPWTLQAIAVPTNTGIVAIQSVFGRRATCHAAAEPGRIEAAATEGADGTG